MAPEDDTMEALEALRGAVDAEAGDVDGTPPQLPDFSFAALAEDSIMVSTDAPTEQPAPSSSEPWAAGRDAQLAHANAMQTSPTFTDTFMASPRHGSLDAYVSGADGHDSVTTSILDEPMAGELGLVGLVLEGPIDRPGMGRTSGGNGGGGSGGDGNDNGNENGDGDGDGEAGGGDGHASNGGGRRPSFAGSKEDKSGTSATPSWSELKTKAGKERKRLPLACIACRRKKIRCSGEKPACKHCVRSRTPCVYKVTARKAAPRTDYMAMLDKRMRRMEDRLIKVMPKIEAAGSGSGSGSGGGGGDDDDDAPPPLTRSVVKPAIPGTTLSSTGAAAVTNGNDAPGGDGENKDSGGDGSGDGGGDSSSSKKRSANEAFGPELDHWALANSTSSLGNGATRSSNVRLQQESEENKLLQEGADALPPPDLQHHLADVYFEKIYGQAYHLLHRPSFMRKLKKGTLPPVLILSVCAVAARFSEHPVFANTQNFLRGEEWASRARGIVTRRYEWPNITILTCLLLLGLHEFGTCQGGRSWALGGQAIRMAYALQLHKDLDRDPLPLAQGVPLSFIDREIRRRTMWACFMMDRFNSSGTDRPTFVKEESVKIQLPIKESHFLINHPGPTENLAGQPMPPVAGMPTDFATLDLPATAKDNMGVAAYMVRTIAVWGRVIHYLNQGGKDTDPHPMWSPESGYAKLAKQAESLLSTLPPTLAYSIEHLHLHDNEGMANQFLFLHIAIQQNILFMNRFAVSSPNGYHAAQQQQQQQQDAVPPKAFVTRAGAKAFAAANRISELLQDAETYTVAAPFVGYCVFLSSTVHIFGVFSGNPAIEATSKANLTTNVKFLSKMKRYWGMFHFMAENLREQYRTCADAARQGTLAHERAMAASPIFQYGDWFDRYPHGVSGSEFGDADSMLKKKEKGDDSVLEHKRELRRVIDIVPASPSGASSVSAGNSGKKNSTGRPLRRKSTAGKKAVHGNTNGEAIASSRGSDPLVVNTQRTSNATVQPPGHSVTARNLQQDGEQDSQGLQHPYLAFLGTQAGDPTDYGALALPQINATNSAVSAAEAAAAAATTYHPVMPPIAFHRHHESQQKPQQPFFSADYLSLSLAQQTNGALAQLDHQLVMDAYAESLDPPPAAVHVAGALDGLTWDSPRSSGGGGGGGSGPSDQRSRAGGGGGGGGGAASAGAVVTSGSNEPHALLGHNREPTSAWFMPFNMEPPELGQDHLSGIGGGGLDPFANIFGGGGGGGDGLRPAS